MPFADPDIASSLSLVIEMQLTIFKWSEKMLSIFFFSKFHNLTVQSCDPDTTNFLSLVIATHFTTRVCPSNNISCFFLNEFQTLTVCL